MDVFSEVKDQKCTDADFCRHKINHRKLNAHTKSSQEVTWEEEKKIQSIIFYDIFTSAFLASQKKILCDWNAPIGFPFKRIWENAKEMMRWSTTRERYLFFKNILIINYIKIYPWKIYKEWGILWEFEGINWICLCAIQARSLSRLIDRSKYLSYRLD